MTQSGAKCVLIVDDDCAIRRATGLRLRAAGYRVLDANDGAEGLQLAIKHQPDMIVLDYRMPVMDGLTMLARLRRHDGAADIPVLLLSANLNDHLKADAHELGALRCLDKPYDPGELLRTVRSATG